MLSNVVLTPIDETELAGMRSQRGEKVVKCNGRYWVESPRGFFRALHWRANMTKAEATKPRHLCWGYHTTLEDDASQNANGVLPLYVLRDLKSYNKASLSSNRRSKINRCYKKVTFVEVTDPVFLCEHGYKILQSTNERAKYSTIKSKAAFRNYVNSVLSPKRGTVIGGFVDDELKGFVVIYTVDSTAYLESVYLDTDALNTNIGTGIVFETIETVRHSGQVSHLIHSPHTPEKLSLCRHKESMGFSLVYIPSKVWFAPPIEKLIRHYRPYAYYRLTGRQECLNEGPSREAGIHRNLERSKNEI